MTTAEKTDTVCSHCGDRCNGALPEPDGRVFCCRGCQTVFELLHHSGLECYYEVSEKAPGTTVRQGTDNKDFLDLPEVKARLISFTNGTSNRVTFYVPAMHCAACIWLLEKLHKLNAGIERSEVNFIRKELTVFFNAEATSLKEVVLLLESLGYTPDLSRQQQNRSSVNAQQNLLVKLGIAGFAFGNIMLFSFPEYLALDEESLHGFKPVFGWLSMLLALPVLLYADIDYLRGAWNSLRLRHLTIDVPLSMGIVALFGRSAYEVISGAGPGFFDSFAGLIFFLLIGRWYQNRTYESLAFDRDFKSYFPMAVNRLVGSDTEPCLLENLRIGDRIQLLHNQVIPADAVLLKGSAEIDYSFVNGEAELVRKATGELLFAGGRNSGGLLEMEVIKPVNQSYLTSLWNQDAFNKKGAEPRFSELISTVSRHFSLAILVLATATLGFWLWHDPSPALNAFTAVLIIACPCALAMSMPFTAGSAARLLGRLGFFVKNAATLERLAKVKAVVFDKTGTLTEGGASQVEYAGEALSGRTSLLIKSAVMGSAHPLSAAVCKQLSGPTLQPTLYHEYEGEGILAIVDGAEVRVGSLAFVSPPNLRVEFGPRLKAGAEVHVAVNGHRLGAFVVKKELRTGMAAMVKALKAALPIHLLSGDNEHEQERMRDLLGQRENIHFRQQPQQKLAYVDGLENQGVRVLMLGDGLNDAGALKRASVGIAVADDVYSFSPACDAILQASKLRYLHHYLRFVSNTIWLVKMALGLSFLYNVVGLYFAVQGQLTPLIAAVLMPLSSVSVIVFVSASTYLIRPRI